jgi:hypothetical protein
MGLQRIALVIKEGNQMKRKCLAVGIILLFVGIACVPGITANINDTSEGFEKSDSFLFLRSI